MASSPPDRPRDASSTPPAPATLARGFRLSAVLFLLTTVGIWGANPLLIKYFAGHYDVWTQNGFRYGCATLCLLAWAAFFRRRTLFLDARQCGMLARTALANVLMQITYAGMFYFVYPSVATLVGRVNVFIVCVLSFLIYHDERRVIRSPFFITGTVLSVVGVVTVVLGQDPETLTRLEVTRRMFWIGIAAVLANALFMSLYALSIRHVMRHMSPVAAFTHVAWMTAAALIALMFAVGRPADLLSGPPWGRTVMALSAVAGILIAHITLYAALRHLKTSVSTSLMQLLPVLTCALSAWYYGDWLSRPQMVGAAAVLGGAWLAGLAQAKADRRGQS